MDGTGAESRIAESFKDSNVPSGLWHGAIESRSSGLLPVTSQTAGKHLPELDLVDELQPRNQTGILDTKFLDSFFAEANEGKPVAVRTWQRFAFMPATTAALDAQATKVSTDNADAVVEMTPFKRNEAGNTVVGGQVGSGFFVDKDGTIATARHVLQAKGGPADGAIIRLSNGEYRVAEVESVSKDFHDLELLKVNPALGEKLFPDLPVSPAGETFHSVHLAKSSYVKPGEQVMAMGFAHGEPLSASPGKYVARCASMQLFETSPGHYGTPGGVSRCIPSSNPDHTQLVSNINVAPGDSGGPIFRISDGAVVGVTTMLSQSHGFLAQLAYPKQGLAERVEALNRLLNQPIG